jgi:hypothetical protein
VTIVDERGVALTLERSQIARLEVGRRRGRGQGALRGALWGGAVAALAGVTVYAMDQGSKREDGLCGDLETGITTCTKASEIPAGIFGGVLFGAVIGSAWPGMEWKPTDSDAFRVAVTPVAGGGVGARATIRF